MTIFDKNYRKLGIYTRISHLDIAQKMYHAVPFRLNKEKPIVRNFSALFLVLYEVKIQERKSDELKFSAKLIIHYNLYIS